MTSSIAKPDLQRVYSKLLLMPCGGVLTCGGLKTHQLRVDARTLWRRFTFNVRKHPQTRGRLHRMLHSARMSSHEKGADHRHNWPGRFVSR